MARVMRTSRKGGRKDATEGKPVEEAVEAASEEAGTSNAVTPQEAHQGPVDATMEAAEGAGVDAPEGTTKSEEEKASGKETPKKGNRKRFKGRKGRKPTDSKEKKIIDFDGLIFMCNTDTKKDCFKYRVFGFPEGKQNIVEQIKKGTKLFLYDIDKKVLHGVYKASSEGGVNLIEEAFKDSKRKFPAQVRFRILKDCMPLDESAFKLAIKENYSHRNRFSCELNAEQVGRLMKLFRPLDSRGLPEPKPVKETKRDAAPRGKALRVPRTQRNRGPPPRFSGPAPPRERVYRDHVPLYPRERPYPESLPPSYALVPEVIPVETGLLRQRYLRQVQEAQEAALDRRTYFLDPVVEASITRTRNPEDVYAYEHLPVKRSLQDILYKDLEYQREAPYRSYGDGLASHTGALHYDPRAPHLGW